MVRDIRGFLMEWTWADTWKLLGVIGYFWTLFWAFSDQQWSVVHHVLTGLFVFTWLLHLGDE